MLRGVSGCCFYKKNVTVICKDKELAHPLDDIQLSTTEVEAKQKETIKTVLATLEAVIKPYPKLVSDDWQKVLHHLSYACLSFLWHRLEKQFVKDLLNEIGALRKNTKRLESIEGMIEFEKKTLEIQERQNSFACLMQQACATLCEIIQEEYVNHATPPGDQNTQQHDSETSECENKEKWMTFLKQLYDQYLQPLHTKCLKDAQQCIQSSLNQDENIGLYTSKLKNRVVYSHFCQAIQCLKPEMLKLFLDHCVLRAYPHFNHVIQKLVTHFFDSAPCIHEFLLCCSTLCEPKPSETHAEDQLVEEIFKKEPQKNGMDGMDCVKQCLREVAQHEGIERSILEKLDKKIYASIFNQDTQMHQIEDIKSRLHMFLKPHLDMFLKQHCFTNDLTTVSKMFVLIMTNAFAFIKPKWSMSLNHQPQQSIEDWIMERISIPSLNCKMESTELQDKYTKALKAINDIHTSLKNQPDYEETKVILLRWNKTIQQARHLHYFEQTKKRILNQARTYFDNSPFAKQTKWIQYFININPVLIELMDEALTLLSYPKVIKYWMFKCIDLFLKDFEQSKTSDEQEEAIQNVNKQLTSLIERACATTNMWNFFSLKACTWFMNWRLYEPVDKQTLSCKKQTVKDRIKNIDPSQFSEIVIIFLKTMIVDPGSENNIIAKIF